jgi:hypothetical protein
VADRGFSSTIETALSASTANIAILAYLNWPGGAVRVWTGKGTVTWSGNNYTGVGNLGSIDKIADSLVDSDIGVQLTLNYLDDALRGQVVANDPVGQDAVLYFAVIDPASLAVTDAYAVFTGFIDKVDIEDNGTDGRIMVRLASELARLARPRFYSLSDAHQRFLFPGDKGMEFASVMDQPIIWGRQTIPMHPGSPYVPNPPSPPKRSPQP